MVILFHWIRIIKCPIVNMPFVKILSSKCPVINDLSGILGNLIRPGFIKKKVIFRVLENLVLSISKF